jgi:hypothetical protein
MKKSVFFAIGALLFLSCLKVSVYAQTGVEPTCASLTVADPTYNQNFDTLAISGTSSTVPVGFGFAETGTGADNTYGVTTGTATAGNTYSLGTVITPGADRAFGGLQTAALNPTIGGCFINNTGAPIASLTITYDGEMYRLGETVATRPTPDRLDFQYSTNATSLTTGTYIDVNALDFTTPNQTGAVGARDGNDPLFRTSAINTTFPVAIAAGQTFFIRFLDTNVTGSDDILGIDNFVLVANAVTAAPAVIGGRVTVGGKGASRVMMMLSGGDLEEPIYTSTNLFGHYKFEDLTVGETYVVQIVTRRYRFPNTSMVISLQDNFVNADFEAGAK